jgi:tRNA(Ile2) C34 agmatinyltransferase TiaS
MMDGGREGTEKGRVRRSVYSSSLMSEVRMREVRPAVKASGGKVGRLKDWRGICPSTN